MEGCEVNNKDNKIISLAMIVLAALWCVVVLVFMNHSDAGFYFWGGFSFGLAAFIIVALSSYLVSYQANQNTTEITMIPAFVSGTFVVFSAIFNFIFVCLKDGEYEAAIVVVNVIAIMCYLIVVYYLTQYAARVTEKADRIAGKTMQFGKIKTEIAGALALCSDEDIKKKVLGLKQQIDYSNNLSQEAVADDEAALYSQIQDIEDLLRNKAEKSDVLSKIAEAEETLKIRNSKLSTIR